MHNLPRIEEHTRVRVLSLRDASGKLLHPAAMKDPEKAAQVAGIRLELGGLRARPHLLGPGQAGVFHAEEAVDALHRLCAAWGLDEAHVRELLRVNGQDELVPLDFEGLSILMRQSLESRPMESSEFVSADALAAWSDTLPKWGQRTAGIEQAEHGLANREVLLSWDTTCSPESYLVVDLSEEFVTVSTESWGTVPRAAGSAP